MKALAELVGRCLPRRSARPRRRPEVTLSYQERYDRQAEETAGDDVIGDGPYDLIGRIELEVLLMEGLLPDHTLVDFGCGNGRLAVHAVPYLDGGEYVGIDICRELLRRADDRVGMTIPEPPCRVRWVHQTAPEFPLEDGSVDRMCAFSVFTHMEHEDTYLYLRAARRVVKPGGRLIFSCLPLDQEVSRLIFEAEARDDLAARWSRVRNVTTSKDLMTAIARMAGWVPLGWYDGQQPVIGRPGREKHALGQSCCVLAAPE